MVRRVGLWIALSEVCCSRLVLNRAYGENLAWRVCVKTVLEDVMLRNKNKLQEFFYEYTNNMHPAIRQHVDDTVNCGVSW